MPQLNGKTLDIARNVFLAGCGSVVAALLLLVRLRFCGIVLDIPLLNEALICCRRVYISTVYRARCGINDAANVIFGTFFPL